MLKLNKFIYVLDKTLADDYMSSKGFLFMHTIRIGNREAWIFSIDNKKLNFENIDKSKVLFMDKLMF